MNKKLKIEEVKNKKKYYNLKDIFIDCISFIVIIILLLLICIKCTPYNIVEKTKICDYTVYYNTMYLTLKELECIITKDGIYMNQIIYANHVNNIIQEDYSDKDNYSIEYIYYSDMILKINYKYDDDGKYKDINVWMYTNEDLAKSEEALLNEKGVMILQIEK